MSNILEIELLEIETPVIVAFGFQAPYRYGDHSGVGMVLQSQRDDMPTEAGDLAKFDIASPLEK